MRGIRPMNEGEVGEEDGQEGDGQEEPLMISLIVKRAYSSSTGTREGGSGVVCKWEEVAEAAAAREGEGENRSFRNQNCLERTASLACAVCMFSST